MAMQQNVQYGSGYHTQLPVAPEYAPPYAPAPSQLPASAYSPAPAYGPAQNSSDPSYPVASHPYAPQVPSISVADPSFSSPNSPYMSSPNTLYNPQSPMGPPSYEATYDPPNSQNPMGPSSYEAAYERPNPQNPTGPPYYGTAYEQSSYDYGNESLPHAISSSALLSQPHGSNPTIFRSCSYQDGFPQAATVGSSPQFTGYADQGGAFISTQPSGYDHRDSAYLQGEYQRSGFEQLESHGQGNYENGPQDSYKLAGIYAYDGGQVEPYGSRGTRPTQTSSISNPLFASGDDAKIARSSPKSDAEGGGSGVPKYRVKLLSESNSSDSPTDVICQIGLDGVRMVVPTTNKLSRIYPLDTITKWEVSDPSTLTFWAKTTVDVEQRRIRLQSNSYTTSAILDTLTAACVQLCEMVDKDVPSEASKGLTSTSGSSEPGSARKSSFADWVTLKSKPVSQEEKQHWVPDEAVKKCTSCGSDFGAFIRRHHCRNCGDIFCDKCTRGRTPLTSDQDAQPVRVCDQCLAEVTQRLMNVESNNKTAVQRPHEDLAKKLQEEMEKNAARKPTRSSSDNLGSSRPMRAVGSSGSLGLNDPPHLWSSQPAPEQSGPRMREVACPTCTVHLEVQVPSFGTETVECGVCHHPFLVTAD